VTKEMKKVVMLFILIFSFISNVFATTLAPIDITTTDMTTLIEYLNQGIITSEQLINLYLERIETYNKTFNAILYVNENAIEEAKLIDQKRQNNESVGSLAGVPIIIKTNIDSIEFSTTAGSKALSDNYPSEDAELIKLLKGEGAIILASANMSEFAFSAHNSYSSYGSVKNAYGTEYSSYGSSGGSAVALALSFGAIALGTDTNSSVRIPASAASLVGIRPTINNISTAGVIPYDTTRDVVGILSKTVEDNATLYSVLTKTEENDITNFDLSKITIGVPTELYIGSNNASLRVNQKTYQPITDLMQEKIDYLESQGATIVYLDKFITSTYYSTGQNTMAGFTFCEGFNSYIKDHNSKITSFQQLNNSNGRIYELSGYVSSCNYKLTTNQLNQKQSYQDYVASIYETYDLDVIIYPTTKNELSKLNETTLNSPGSHIGSVIDYPSITVPLGTIDNLPYGIEFLAQTSQEELLYKIAYQYEQSTTLITTSLAPNLYEIPASISTLVNSYQDLINENKSTNNDLIEEIKTFFQDYNEIENLENNATILLDQIDNRNNVFINSIKELFHNEENNMFKMIITIITIIIGLPFILIIFLLIRKKIRKKS